MITPETNGPTKTLQDACNYKGKPAVRSQTGGWTAAAMILVIELNERLTTLGIAVNLVPYITGTMYLDNATAANIVTNFMGTSFMLCLLGGFVADTFLGRYLTIAIFTAVQSAGVILLTISTSVPGLRPTPCTDTAVLSCPKATSRELSIFYLSLYLISLGTGGLKSSVSGFGSDQFDETDANEKKYMMKFFNWFFFFISLGSMLAVTVLVYIQDNVGRHWGYGLCAASIVVGLSVFIAGTTKYRFKSLVGSPLTQIASVVVCAWRKRMFALPVDSSLLYDMDMEMIDGEMGGKKRAEAKRRLPHTKQFRFLDHAAIHINPTISATKWQLSTLTNVEEVKMVVRMLPIWATTIMFWTVYAQMTTFSVAQATTMNRNIGKAFMIPSGSLTAFFVGSILITVPIYDRIVVPTFRRLTGNPQGLTPLQRIAVGLVLSILAMACAALVEIKRLNAVKNLHHTLAVFWLVPQFFLVGAGEAFTYIGQLDFFLRECPMGMKTMSTGLFLATLSLGFFFSSALVAVVGKVTGRNGGHGAWFADNLDDGKLYNFYWLLAALCLANFVVYLFAAKWYVYKDRSLELESDIKVVSDGE